MTDYFAEVDEGSLNHKSYFVWDDQYIYIVDLNDKNREKLNSIYDYSYNEDENAEAPAPVTISGMTKKIPTDLRDLAISSYNKLFDKNFLTKSNFEDYLGVVYLDTFETPTSVFLGELVYALPTLVVGLVFLLIYFRQISVTKKCIARLGSKWDNVLNDVSSADLIYYKKAKLYLTNNFLISYASGLEVYDYNDIVWVYPYEYRYNGSVTQKSIFVITKDSKAHKVANVSASKKNLVLFDEMYNTFMNKMPNVLSGYTKENKAKAKELYIK